VLLEPPAEEEGDVVLVAWLAPPALVVCVLALVPPVEGDESSGGSDELQATAWSAMAMVTMEKLLMCCISVIVESTP
jgi:hypothetical protein